jgi:MFS family permease
MFFTGAWMQTVVMAWLIYELTDSVFLLGVFTTARLFPMLFGPIGGVLADRFDRPRMLLGIQIMAFGVASILALLVFTNHVQFWHLLLGGFLIGIGQTPSQPARATMVMEIVGRKDLANATALNTLTLTSSQITGAAVGGAILAATDAGSAFIVAGFCFFLSGLTLLPLKDLDKNVQKSKNSPITDLIDGFSFVFKSREILALLSVTITANIFVWPIFQSFLPVFAKDILKAGPGGLGLITAAAGTGAIIGSLLIANMGDFNWKGRLLIIGTGLLGLF